MTNTTSTRAALSLTKPLERLRLTEGRHDATSIVTGAGTINRESGPITVALGVVIPFAPNDWHRADFTEDTLLVEMNLRDTTTAGV